MRRPSPKFLVFCLLALSGGATFARAAAAAQPKKDPTADQLTAADLQNPEIAHPKDTAVECDSEYRKNPNHPEKFSKPCMNQLDSFKRNAEATSYLAFYQEQFSNFGLLMKDPGEKAKFAQSIQACLTAGGECSAPDQNRLIQALVQYNFGKDLRRIVLESNTLAENMHTLDYSPQELRQMGIPPKKVISGKRNTLSAGSAREGSFRLDPMLVHEFALHQWDPGSLPPQDRDKLGADFSQNFDNFVNTYTSSAGKSRWHYVAARSAAVDGSGQTWVIAGGNANRSPSSPQNVDKIGGRGRLDSDVKREENPLVKEIVARYKAGFTDARSKGQSEKVVTDSDKAAIGAKDATKKKFVDSMRLAYETAGFGLPEGVLAQNSDKIKSERDNTDNTAQFLTMLINKKVLQAEKKTNGEAEADGLARMPSSSNTGPANRPKVLASVGIDVAEFGHFLDDIWPPSAPARAQKAEDPKKGGSRTD